MKREAAPPSEVLCQFRFRSSFQNPKQDDDSEYLYSKGKMDPRCKLVGRQHKVLLELAMLRQKYIKGSGATQDRRTEAYKEISDSVSALGVPRTPDECAGKLCWYTCEVKAKFAEKARAAMRSGASGGSPVKNLNPTHVQQLALAFLGIEKLEVKAAKRDHLSQDDDGDDGSEADDRGSTYSTEKKTPKKRKAIPPNTIDRRLDELIINQENMEERLIGLEVKIDDIIAGRPQIEHNADIIMDAPPRSPSPPPPPPGVAVPFNILKTAFADFFLEANDDHWGKLLVTSIQKNEPRVKRELVYIKLLALCSEDEIDEMLVFFIDSAPEYIKGTLAKPDRYYVLTAVGNELVANRRITEGVPQFLVGEAKKWQLLHLAENKPSDASISKALATVFPDVGHADTSTTQEDAATNVVQSATLDRKAGGDGTNSTGSKLPKKGVSFTL